MGLKVTAEVLKRADACAGDVRRFKREWPDGAELTLKNFLRAVELELDLGWFAAHFLWCGALVQYNAALEGPRCERRQARRDAGLRRKEKGRVRGQKRKEARVYKEATERVWERYFRAQARVIFQVSKTGIDERMF